MLSSIRTRFVVAIALGAAFLVPAIATGTASAAKSKTLVVCKHGCKFRTIQSAVDKSGRNATIKVKPGKYVEGVLVEGSKHDGLKIIGTGKSPGAVVLDGKNAKDPEGSTANHGVEGNGADNLTIENLKVTHYAANGVYLHGLNDSAKTACHGFLMKDLIAAYNRSYGLFAYNCTGGRITRTVGYGHGDSAWYIGATPTQKKPKWTQIDHSKAYLNVIGFSGTNSKYVNIHDNDIYNNGLGIVPSTLDSEPFEPNGHGIIENNRIHWNNLNYFLPNSPTKTISGGLGEVFGLTVNYPTGVGVLVFGGDGWKVRKNQIFGNFKWGAAAISDGGAINEGDDAISRNNQFTNNVMGRNGADTNGVDFFADGSGSGNCFSGNGAGATLDPSPTATNASLYPGCPALSSGSGTSTGDATQFGEVVGYVLSTPPETQECSWIRHSHPAFNGLKPVKVTPGPACP